MDPTKAGEKTSQFKNTTQLVPLTFLLEVFEGLTGKEIPGQNSQEHYKHVNCILHSAATHLFKNARGKKNTVFD